MPRFRDPALCLRRADWSESSQVVALLCRTHGKVRGLAKGSKRASPGSAARFSGGIELLDRGEVVATTRRGQGLSAVTEWDLQRTWPHLRRSWRCQHAALYAAEITEAALPDEDPHPEVFDALLALLADLDHAAQTETTERNGSAEVTRAEPRTALLLGYQWRLLDAAGYRPVLDADIDTGEPLPAAADLWFDPMRGGLTARSTPDAWGVRKQTVAALRTLAENQDSPPHDAATADRANRLLASYWRHLLEREPASYRSAIASSGATPS
ncbi:MAG: DNA repair protein RecO C-terminal domain-containing protein [Planctomycetota bacterium]